jgi:hypothetical protein
MTRDEIEELEALASHRNWRWLPGMAAWYAPVGSQNRRWALEEDKAIRVRILRIGAQDQPKAVLWCTADGESLPRGGVIADCLLRDLVPDLTDNVTRLVMAQPTP